MAKLVPEHRIVAHCQEAGLTLCTAESCTGGLIAHRITDVPGASSVFLGGIVAYANEVKTGLLGASEALIEAHGAVSEPVARAMATGARRALGADLAVAATGIAGPGGGTPEKPVGTVWIAAAGSHVCLTRRCRFEGDRNAVKAQTADAALTLILELLELP